MHEGWMMNNPVGITDVQTVRQNQGRLRVELGSPLGLVGVAIVAGRSRHWGLVGVALGAGRGRPWVAM